MNTDRIIATLSKTDAAYIAGLIDGEGTVTLVRKHRNEYRQLSVSISSTELGLLEFVKSRTDAGKITHKRTASEKHSPSYTYAIYNRQALDLLDQVYEYLKSYKRQRSRLILDQYLLVTPRNGKYSPEMLDRKKAFEKRVLSIRANSGD